MSFDFTKTTPYDLHVIIAVNGAGKTNLLNAINWCLYGDEPHTAGTDEQDVSETIDKLVRANKDAIMEAKSNGEKYCSINVCIEGEEGTAKYVFERSASIDVDALTQHGKDSFEVREYKASGATNIYGSDDHTEDTYKEVRDLLLPQTIREYFFFDGDQLLDYFGNNSATSKVSHLKNSIYEISQVSVVEKAREHLRDMEKEVSRKIKGLSPHLQEVADKLEDARAARSQKEKEIETIKNQITQAKRDLAVIEKKLAGTETIIEDNQRLNGNNDEIKELEDDCRDLKEKVARFIRKYFDRFMLYEINRENDEYIRQRLDESSTPILNIEAMKASLDHSYKCALCGEPLKPERIKEFQEFVQKYESNFLLQTLSAIQPDLHKGMDIADYAKEKEKLFEGLGKKKNRIKRLREENEELYKRINLGTQDLKGLEDLGGQKKHLRALIEQNSTTLGKYEQQLVELKRKEEAADEEYTIERTKSDECKEFARKQKFLQKSILIITDVIDGIVSAVKKEMEEKTFELFRRFVWDADRFDHIELDDYFRLKIYDAVTKQSCLRSCSAGEKELLALAFTLAIHEVSGYDNLLFIDTPVGRLSGINRSNFAEVLKEVSEKKQIILAFTDTEFSVEVADVFTNRILSSSTVLDGGILETTKKGVMS